MNFEKLYQDANKVFPIDFDRLQDNLAGKNFYVVVSDADLANLNILSCLKRIILMKCLPLALCLF